MRNLKICYVFAFALTLASAASAQTTPAIPGDCDARDQMAAEGGADRKPTQLVAEGSADRKPNQPAAEGGADRSPLLAEAGTRCLPK